MQTPAPTAAAIANFCLSLSPSVMAVISANIAILRFFYEQLLLFQLNIVISEICSIDKDW